MAEIRNQSFVNFEAAIKAVEDYCKVNHHPVHVHSKEKVASYNRKVKEESRVTDLAPDAVYACR